MLLINANKYLKLINGFIHLDSIGDLDECSFGELAEENKRHLRKNARK